MRRRRNWRQCLPDARFGRVGAWYNRIEAGEKVFAWHKGTTNDHVCLWECAVHPIGWELPNNGKRHPNAGDHPLEVPPTPLNVYKWPAPRETSAADVAHTCLRSCSRISYNVDRILNNRQRQGSFPASPTQLTCVQPEHSPFFSSSVPLR